MPISVFLDFFESVVTGLSAFIFGPLQPIFHIAELFSTNKLDHVTSLFKIPSWLSVTLRKQSKGRPAAYKNSSWIGPSNLASYHCHPCSRSSSNVCSLPCAFSKVPRVLSAMGPLLFLLLLLGMFFSSLQFCLNITSSESPLANSSDAAPVLQKVSLYPALFFFLASIKKKKTPKTLFTC